MTDVLRVDDLGKSYPTARGPLTVLAGVSMRLEPGAAIAIMGPSGSGKSTLLNILGTLDRPTRGSVRLGDVDPLALGESELAAFRNQRLGFVFQEHHLLPQCSVLENVLIPALPSRRAQEVLPRARFLLERVGLADRIEHRPGELSGGERQRAALARALINRPGLLLADEPTGNLDRETAETVGRLLFELQVEERFILIVATHSMPLAEGLPERYDLRDARLVLHEVDEE